MAEPGSGSRLRACHAFAVRQLLLGVSASGARCEGGFNGPGEPANHWSAWERTGKVPRGAGGDLWASPERALDRAAAAGAAACLLSLEWARVEPAPGRPDDAALDRYAHIFSLCTEREMQPIVVLHDLTHPEWLGEEFWLTPGSPDRFCDHVTRVVSRLGTTCTHWVTSRQPNAVALGGWVGGRHPPRRVGALSDAWAVVDNLLAAHVLAYEAIHDVQSQWGPEVTIGLRASSSYDWQRMFVDLLCGPALGVAHGALDGWVRERRARHDAVTPPRGLLDLAARRLASFGAPFGATLSVARRPSPRRIEHEVFAYAQRRGPADVDAGRGVRPLDALLTVWRPPAAASLAAPDALTSGARALVARALGTRALGTTRVARVAPWEVRPDPEALGAWCREQAALTPGLALWIEDGFATCRSTARADGWDRAAYLRAQTAAVAQARASGAPVVGYLAGSLCEGADPTWPDADFGLDVDRLPAAAERSPVTDR